MMPPLILLMLPTYALGQAQDVFVEAETSPHHTFNEAADFPGIVSGDKILRLWKAEDPPPEGYLADLPFSVPQAGSYYIWLAASVPSATSSFWWRLDGGEWRHRTDDDLDEVWTPFGVSSAMAWMELAQAQLAAGTHTLTVRVNERRPILEHAYLLYLDALLVTPRDVVPNGLVSPADLPKLAPRPVPPPPVPRAGKPGPPLMLGTSVAGSGWNKLVKSLGFSVLQTDSDHLDVNETSPGVWDWSAADQGLAACRRVGVGWQYFPHYHWPPEWYRKTDRFVPCTGLRSGRKLACMSLWSPDILPWFDHCYAALAEHYGQSADAIAAIYVGVHGDFGEAIFPMGFHPGEKERFGAEGTGLGDFWCGAEPDRADFRRVARGKYPTIEALNAAWGTAFASFEVADYPPEAYGKPGDVAASPQSRRYWLDFVEWYFGSMTRFTADVCRIARKHLPKAMLVLPLGGGAETLFYGQDNTALPKIAAELGVHIRSTHGGFVPFRENYASMNRRIATASKHYGAPFWTEPPGTITAEGEVSRIMESVSCGSWGFWDWATNPVTSPNVFREYKAFLTREEPVVDVALFFPTTHYRLHYNTAYPPRLWALGARLRDVMDYDIVDEMLIRDAALRRYRVLAWLEGSFVEAETLRHLAQWVEAGGVLLKLGAAAPQTVEGDGAAAADLLGLTQATSATAGKPVALTVVDRAFLRHVAAQAGALAGTAAAPLAEGSTVLATAEGRPAAWAVKHGKGWVIVWAGEEDAPEAQGTCCELVRDVVYNLSALDRTKADAREVDTAWDDVCTTLFANGEAFVHNLAAEPRTVTIAGRQIPLPAKAIRSAVVP
jgi:Glycosyl hydrolase family 14